MAPDVAPDPRWPTVVDPATFGVDAAAYRAADHGWLDELDRRAVHVGEPHQRMGTRLVDPAEWLIIDEHYQSEVALRRRLVAGARDAVYQARADSRAGAAEAASLVAAWLACHHPAAQNTSAIDPATWAEHEHPLLGAGTAVQEDLCVMERRNGAWRLTAALVCFPTHWNLPEKFDRSQEQIHAPVPHYADDLAAKVSTFFDRLAPDKVACRRNWGFAAQPLLFLPRRTDLATAAVDGPESIWFRSERQTLRRLPSTGAVLFTIKVQMAPMAALADRPELCARLVASLQGFSPEMQADRGSSKVWMRDVIAWLAEAASA